MKLEMTSCDFVRCFQSLGVLCQLQLQSCMHEALPMRTIETAASDRQIKRVRISVTERESYLYSTLS